MAGPVAAQDFQIGGDGPHEVSVPLEIRPSLGLFVLGYINGRGPYRFSLSMTQRTLLTPVVVMDAGLATRDKGIMLNGGSNHYEQNLQLTDATLRLGDRNVSLNGARVFPDHDPSGYVPVPNYGGVLGVEVFLSGIVRLDLSHARLVLSPQADTIPPPDAIELSLEQSAVGSEFDRLPAIALSLDGQPGKFRVTFSTVSVSFQENSALGRELLDKSPHQVAARAWAPDAIVRLQIGTVTGFAIGGHEATRTISVSRNLDPPPMPVRSSPSVRVVRRGPSIDGLVGLGVLAAFDITIDDLAGKMWLTRRDKASFPCSGASKGNFRGTTGIAPWLYKGKGVVNMVTEGSPAETAGIAPGDQIVSIDGGDVPAFYDHLDATCLAPAPVTVVFRNASGDHTAVLSPAAR